MGSPATDKVLPKGVAAIVHDVAEFSPVDELFQTHLKRWRRKTALIVAQRRKAEAQLATLWRDEPQAPDPDKDEHWPARRIYSPDRSKSELFAVPPELDRKLKKYCDPIPKELDGKSKKYNDPSRYHLLRELDNKQDFSTTESFILLAELHDAAYPKDQLGYHEDQVHIVGLAEATKILDRGLSQVAVQNLATLVERVLDLIEARADSESTNKTGKTLQQIIQRSREKLADLVIRSRPQFVSHTDRESGLSAAGKSRSNATELPEAQGRLQQTDTGGLRGKAGDETSSAAVPNAESVPQLADNMANLFEVQNEFVRIRGFGEDVMLKPTAGVDRLIAIVTSRQRRVSVWDLVKIGAEQERAASEPVDCENIGLVEHETLDDDADEFVLGADANQAVKEAVGKLIARKKDAQERGDFTEAKRLKEQIDATLEPFKKALKVAAKTVSHSLNRTYQRLRKEQKGPLLAGHFERYVKRLHKESDFVYVPDEQAGQIVWKLK